MEKEGEAQVQGESSSAHPVPVSGASDGFADFLKTFCSESFQGIIAAAASEY